MRSAPATGTRCAPCSSSTGARCAPTGSTELLDRALDAVPTDVFEQQSYLQLIAAARCYDRDDPTGGDALLSRAVTRHGHLSGRRRRALFGRDLALVRPAAGADPRATWMPA